MASAVVRGRKKQGLQVAMMDIVHGAHAVEGLDFTH